MKNGKLRIALVGLSFGAEFAPIYLKHPDVDSLVLVDSNRELLDKIGDTDVSQSLADIKTSLADTVASEPLFQKKYWKPIAIAFFVATFNQLSGINAINY